MVRLKTGIETDLAHALNSTGINHAFNTHQRSRYFYAGNDTVEEYFKQESEQVNS